MSYGENFLRTVFKSASSGNRFNGPVSLYLNFGVLFPAADICRHVIKGNLLLQEFIHLSLDGVLISSSNEGGCIINACHCVKVFVLAREDATTPKVIIEKVFPVTAIRNAIVHQQLQNNFNSRLTVEGEVFTIACDDLSVFL